MSVCQPPSLSLLSLSLPGDERLRMSTVLPKPPWLRPELPDARSSPIPSNPSTEPSEVSPLSPPSLFPLPLRFAGKSDSSLPLPPQPVTVS